MTNLQIPDQLAEQIEATANAEGIPVHELLQRMLREYQQLKHTPEVVSADEITSRLDTLYTDVSSSLDPVLLRLQSRSLERDS